MDDHRLGAAIRLLRRKRGWRQRDLAAKGGVSQTWISRLERGHFDAVNIGTLRRVLSALEVRLDLEPRWRAGELHRLLASRHSALHESVARRFGASFPDWVLAPEVSFSIYGERGIIDVLAWHPVHRALLVMELKAELVDVNETIGTLDRKRRLAPRIAADRGWNPATVSQWLILEDSRTTRRRIAAHQAVLRAAYPGDGRAIRTWLAAPTGSISALSAWPADAPPGHVGRVRVVPDRTSTTANARYRA